MVAPKYGGGRCWPAHGPRSVLGNRRAARNVAPGPWLLQFHTTEENKNFFCKCRWASRLGRQYSPVFFRSYRDLCKYIYLTIEYNSLKKNASVFPALCPNTQHLLVIRQKYLHQNQVVCEPTKFQSNTPTLLRTPPAPRFPTRNSTLQPSPRQGRPLLTPLKNRTHNVNVIIMLYNTILLLLYYCYHFWNTNAEQIFVVSDVNLKI